MFKGLMLIGAILTLLSSSVFSAIEPYSIDVVCSSFLNNDPRYSIGNIFDNNIQTCWVEGVPSSGSGLLKDKIYVHCDEWSILPYKEAAEQFMCYMSPFPPCSMEITKMRIYNGYGKSEILWKANNRVKKLGIEIYGNTGKIVNNDYSHVYNYRLEIPLQDKGWNDVVFSDYLNEDETVNYVQSIHFYILDTYKGSKYNDTCISEIEFYCEDEKYSIDKVRVIKAEYGFPKGEEE